MGALCFFDSILCHLYGLDIQLVYFLWLCNSLPASQVVDCKKWKNLIEVAVGGK